MIPVHHSTYVIGIFVHLTFVTVCFTLANNDETFVDSTHGELGRQRLTRSSEEEELEDVCACLAGSSYPNSRYCLDKFRDYGPIIRQGTCYGDLSMRNKRSLKRRDATFSSPPTFIENKKCRGTKTIILASSGKERQLTLTTQASVFICKGSIDANLQQLFVTGVSKIVIAKGALKKRDSDLEIRFSSLEEKIIIPEEAFSIPITIMDSSPDTQAMEADRTHLPPPKIRLEIDTANEVEFRSRSIVAPIVQVRLNQVKNVRFGSNSVIPYAHPVASSFEVSHCHSVTMDPQTTNTGKFEAKHIKHLLMKERAVEVVADDGAGARIEYVSNITLLDEALSIGSGADILLNNLTFTSAGVRAIQGTGPGNLRRAAFTYVTGKQLASVAMCIRAETAVVYNVEIRGNNDSHVGACIEGQMVHQSDNAGVTVICQKADCSPDLCDDPRCSSCAFEAKGNTTAVPFLPITLDPSAAQTSSTRYSFIQAKTDPTTTMTSSALLWNTTDIFILSPTTNISTDQETASNFPTFSEATDTNLTIKEGQPPVYIIVIIVCAVVIFLAFIMYMIYRCCTRSKHDKYYLPHENRLSSFRNPRTIMTPENLASHGNTMHCSHANAPEVFTTYDPYRQPNVAYIPASQPIAISNSPRSEQHSPPPAYEPPDTGSQDVPPPGYMSEGYYPHCESGLPPGNQIPPPPEGYSHTLDEQITSRISLSSESSSPGASSSDDDISTPRDYSPSPDGNFNVPAENCTTDINQQCYDNKGDDKDLQQQALGNKFYI